VDGGSRHAYVAPSGSWCASRLTIDRTPRDTRPYRPAAGLAARGLRGWSTPARATTRSRRHPRRAVIRLRRCAVAPARVSIGSASGGWTERDDRSSSTAGGSRYVLKVAHPPTTLRSSTCSAPRSSCRGPRPVLVPLVPPTSREARRPVRRRARAAAGLPPGDVPPTARQRAARLPRLRSRACRFARRLLSTPAHRAAGIPEAGSLRLLDYVPTRPRAPTARVLDGTTPVGAAVAATRQQVLHNDLNPTTSSSPRMRPAPSQASSIRDMVHTSVARPRRVHKLTLRHLARSDPAVDVAPATGCAIAAARDELPAATRLAQRHQNPGSRRPRTRTRRSLSPRTRCLLVSSRH
jgi:hypothetical protein